MKQKLSICLQFSLLLFVSATVFSQSFSPVNLTGFNNDVIAETGTSSLTTTTSALDGVTVSNKVMYTVAFKTANSFGGGGIPDNGTITDAAGTYQLAAYNTSNALIVQRSQNADLSLVTPASFNTIRILCFATEGTSLVNVKLFFTDGSSTTALTNYSLGDWFNGTTNLVLSGFGRCTRATPASGADAYSTNPRFYYIEVPLSCTDRQKNLQKINFANVTTAGNNAPYPNAVFFALSGKAYTQSISSVITNATCAASGSAALTVTGSSSPFTYSWNTTPVQTVATATNLAPGNYQCTITDANSCTSVYPVTISLQNNLTMTTHLDTAICSGASFNANTISNASGFSWSPVTGVSNTTIANPVLSPSATTQYTITGTLGANCTISRSFTVTVSPAITVNAGTDVNILAGQTVQLQGTGPQGTYLWTPATGLSATNILNPIASPQVTTTYTLRITTSLGCTNTDDVMVTVVPYCVKPMEAFTPNGDGINDKWLITNGNCLSKAKVQVFNRYGSKVFESQNYQNDWQGTYKGKPLPDATYYFVINYFLLDGRAITAKGNVTILR